MHVESINTTKVQLMNSTLNASELLHIHIRYNSCNFHYCSQEKKHAAGLHACSSCTCNSLFCILKLSN